MNGSDKLPPDLDRLESLVTSPKIPGVEAPDPPAQPAPAMEIDDLSIDTGAWRVARAGAEVHLARLEFILLACLAQHADQVVTYDEIARALWQGASQQYGRDAVLNVAARLRRRLGNRADGSSYFVAVPGVGYRWEAERVNGERSGGEQMIYGR